MSCKPYANDWKRLDEHTEFSESANLYYHRGRVYCPQSASHNGIIGAGRQLADMLKSV
jgi:hypothetical protein